MYLIEQLFVCDQFLGNKRTVDDICPQTAVNFSEGFDESEN